jgi:hypothetical protein
MNQKEIQKFVTGSVVIGVLVWLTFYGFLNFEVLSLESMKYMNLGVSASTLFWVSYFKWMWKWPYSRKLLYRPNLNGTWLGEFDSDWKNSLGQVNPPKRFVLVIRQHWFSISIRAFTNLQKTESYVETLIFDDEVGKKLLAYLFSEKRSQSGDHGSRQGAAELDLIEDGSERFLEGHFWTQAGTRGYIRVNQASCSQHLESFEQAEVNWINHESWALVRSGDNP